MKRFIFLSVLFMSFSAQALELVTGEEKVNPGIGCIFEGAIKDHIMPATWHCPAQ